MLRRLAAVLCLVLPLQVAAAGLIAPCAVDTPATAATPPSEGHDRHGESHHGEAPTPVQHGEGPAPLHGTQGCPSAAACTVVMLAGAPAPVSVLLPDESRQAARVEAWDSVTRTPELPPPRR